MAAFAMIVAQVVTSCVDSTGPNGHVRQRWYQRQLGWGDSRPVVVGNTVYFTAGDGWMVAYDTRTGAVRWARQLAHEEISGPNLVARHGVVVAALTWTTIAVDAASGRELWRYYAPPDTTGTGSTVAAPGEVVLAHLTVDDQVVYVPAWGGTVSAVDVLTGAVRWTWRLGRLPTDTATSGVFRSAAAGVAVGGDTVYATVSHFRIKSGVESDTWLVALDRTTGRQLWIVAVPKLGSGISVGSTPIVTGKLVIFSLWGGHTYAIDRLTRRIAWEYNAKSQHTSLAQAELFDGVVYVDGGDDHMYAIDAANGHVIWSAQFATQTTRDMLLTRRRVVFSNGGTLYVLDRLTGRQIVQVVQPGTWDSFFASAPAYADGQIFVTVGDGAWSFDEP